MNSNTVENASPIHPPLSQPRDAVINDALPMDTDTPATVGDAADAGVSSFEGSADIGDPVSQNVTLVDTNHDDGNGPVGPQVIQDVFTAGAALFSFGY